MEVDASSLEVAKSSFLSILSRVDPCESASFVEWVIQHCSNINTNGNNEETMNETVTSSAEKRLKKIVKDIKKRVPLQGIMASENICHPEEGKVMLKGQCHRSVMSCANLPLHLLFYLNAFVVSLPLLLGSFYITKCLFSTRIKHAFSQTEHCHSRLATSVIFSRSAINSIMTTNMTTETVKCST